MLHRWRLQNTHFSVIMVRADECEEQGCFVTCF
jgi:hypothetical protein